MLLELMDELGADAAATLMIGDTEYDMQMAVNARTKALAVSYGVHPVERLMPHAPLDCIHDIAALPAWLTGYAYAEPRLRHLVLPPGCRRDRTPKPRPERDAHFRVSSTLGASTAISGDAV
jgi:hypothetical protein